MGSGFVRLLMVVLFLIAASPSWIGLGCSGDARDATLEGNLLRYNEVDMASFRLSGSVRCDACDEDEVAGLYIELVPRDNPTSYLETGMFSGLNGFYFQDLRAVAGSTVDVYGMLFMGEVDESSALKAETSFTVPDDGETAAVTLRFSTR